MPFATTWIDLVGIMLNEISLTEKNRYHMIKLTGRNPKNKIDETKAESDRESKSVVARGEGRKGRQAK